MQFLTIQRILGILLGLFSFTLLPPIGVSLYYHDGATEAFVDAFLLLLLLGILFWLPVRKHRKELKTRDGFLVVVMFWVTLGLSGAIPFFLNACARNVVHRCGIRVDVWAHYDRGDGFNWLG
jgi:trk system potassium uptake protein TrkH